MPNTQHPDGIELNYTIEANAVVWLRSLPEDELGPSARMVEDIQAAATATPFSFNEIVIRDRAELLDALRSLVEKCVNGFRPILHFDCHGNREGGLVLAPSGDIVSWNDLADALREINVVTQNNLCCVFGVCFGLTLSQTLEALEPSPFFLTIAPESEVLVGVLEDSVPCFYKELFCTGDINVAFETHLGKHFKFYHSTELMFIALAQFQASNLMGRGLREFRESQVSLVLGLSRCGVIPEPQLAITRKVVKEILKPSQVLLNLIVNRCFMGRDPGFGLQEIDKIARKLKIKMDQKEKEKQKRAKIGLGPRDKSG
ncbi:hypothetical protein [Acetobacter fabarum]|uniref:hypothetical protein n=1 Tax=Acetobacter fabarum TaxID=483199 RepID=UPI0020A15032|nr:hypothetical protein [Acetobacter fabarum]MCP1227752.1 hypothetical protein [Acetobacter fabarum]MCP1234751.1 hypothetical protein [Acetobacter fabarum]